MNKHAFLIIAHKNDLTFNTLIKLLDHPNNDIFIHMDKKLENYNPKLIEAQIKYSNIYHVLRTDVRWGGYSQINAELLLLKKANNVNKYVHYHLLSGEDLPIKKMEEIHSFFEKNIEKNFLRFESPVFQHDYRVRYYHFFQDIFGRGNKFTRIASKLFIKIQKIIGVYRHNEIEFQKGSNWFSINVALTEYVIEKEYEIKKIFSNTFCCDEVFMQTLVHNTHFKNSLYHQEYDNELKSIMRYIDWDRGQPYIFRELDFTELLDSPYLFARKFNSEIDESVIKKVAQYINS